MRLTDAECAIIRDAATAVFGADARVLLFGSRVDDSKRGGDIDLLVEVEPRADLDQDRSTFWEKLQDGLGWQRIDVLVVPRGRPLRPIEVIAYETGVPV